MNSAISKKKVEFFNKLKFEEDTDKENLIKYQKYIKDNKNEKEFISKVVEELDNSQIENLINLYQKDIDKLKTKINIDKRKMLSIKSEW